MSGSMGDIVNIKNASKNAKIQLPPECSASDFVEIKITEQEYSTSDEKNWFIHFLKYILLYGRLIFVVPASLTIKENKCKIQSGSITQVIKII